MQDLRKSRRLATWNQNVAKKTEILGMCIHKARRLLISSLVRKLFSDADGELYCFRCGEQILGEFHIDHKQPWQYTETPQLLYFSLDNVALSHPLCNSLIKRRGSMMTQAEKALRRIMLNRVHQKKYRFKKKQLLESIKHGNKDNS